MQTNHFSVNTDSFTLESIIDMMPGHVYWKDKNCVFLGCNTQLVQTFGFPSKDSIIGKTGEAFARTKEEAENMHATDLEVIKTGKQLTFETSVQEPSGTVTTYFVKKVPLCNQQGEIQGIVTISFDITDQKRLAIMEQEQKLNNAKIKTMELFANNIAGELYNSIAALKIGAMGIQKYLPPVIEDYQHMRAGNRSALKFRPSKVQEMLDVLQNFERCATQAEHMVTTLVRNISDINTNPDKCEICSMRDIVNEALARYPFTKRERKLVHWNGTQEIDFFFLGNREIMTHVVFNILKNAIYAVHAWSENHPYKESEVFIEIKPDSTQNSNALVIKDTGCGIAPDILPYIFDAFFTTKGGFAGLGLNFCKKAVEAYKGKIQFASVVDDYTEVTITLPPLPKGMIPPQQNTLLKSLQKQSIFGRLFNIFNKRKNAY